MICFIISFGHIVQALLNNPEALPHFFHAHNCTVVTVAIMRNWYVEVEIFVSWIRPLLPEVPIEAARSESRACYTPFNSFFKRVNANAFRACFKKAVAHHHFVVFPQLLWEVWNKIAHQLIPSIGKILCHSADTKPAGMDSSTTDSFNDVEYFLTIGEHVKYRWKLAEILRKCAEPNEVTVDAEQFAQHHANNFCTVGKFDARQLFYCK